MPPRSLGPLALAVLLGACTERQIDDPYAANSDSDGPVCPPSDPLQDVVARSSVDRCSFEGIDDRGRTHELVCEGTGGRFVRCVWFTDGVEQCECNEPDFTLTCANGLPVCVGWLASIDLAEVDYE